MSPLFVLSYSRYAISMKRFLWIGGLFVLLMGGVAWSSRGFLRESLEDWRRPSLPPATGFVAEAPATSSTQPVCQKGFCVPISTPPGKAPTGSNPSPATPPKEVPKVVPPSEPSLPTQVNLAVPFLSQAPKQNWDMPYQEACEEAAMIMANAYFSDTTKSFTPETGDRAILDLVAFEESQGLAVDITAAEAAALIPKYFPKRKARVIQNPTITQIREYLAKGIPVIVAADGKALKNPNFRNGGPPYHMLVIKGYLPDGRWITNDPGTRKGADYIYDREILFKAIRDWNGGDVPRGTPSIIIMEPIS